MLQIDFLRGYEPDLLIDFGLVLLAGFLIGTERESRHKPAGISTHSFVIGGSMIFTYISAHVDPHSSSRIAAQLVTGVGFLGSIPATHKKFETAGVNVFHFEGNKIKEAWTVIDGLTAALQVGAVKTISNETD